MDFCVVVVFHRICSSVQLLPDSNVYVTLDSLYFYSTLHYMSTDGTGMCMNLLQRIQLDDELIRWTVAFLALHPHLPTKSTDHSPLSI